MTKTELFEAAWWDAKRASRRFGGKASDFFSLSLKKAWVTFKLENSPKQKSRPRRRIIVNHNALVLNVPFSEKDFAKSQGAKWHPTQKTWYYENGKRLPQSLEKYL